MSQSVWVGRISRSATYEELWAFLTQHCGALESLEHVPHKGFAVAVFVNPEDAARTRENQTLQFHGSTLWMDSVWEKGSKRPRSSAPKFHTHTFTAAPHQIPQAPKQIVLKRNLDGRAASAQSTLHHQQPAPQPSRPIIRTQLPPIVAVRPQSQTPHPQIQPVRPRPTSLPQVLAPVSAPLLAPQQVAPRVRPTLREVPVMQFPLEEDYPEPWEQPSHFKRRREEPAESRLAPNFSISIDNTGVPAWGEEDSEPVIGSLYPTSSARFSQLSAQPPSIVLQPHQSRTAQATTYYDDYASSKILNA